MAELTEAQEAALKAEHGKIVRVTLDGQTLVFRRVRSQELQAFLRRGSKQPDMAVTHCIGLCKSVLVWPEGAAGQTALDELADQYPLTFAGQNNDGVVDALVSMAKGDAAIEVK